MEESTHEIEMASAAPLSISVIVPAYNAEATLGACLAPLLRMQSAGEILEIILVDDGSSDATPAIAAQAGVRTMPSGGRLGPGGARNAAAASARGDVLWFVDADAVVHADAARVLSVALADGAFAAVFGAYDDRPSANSFWSQYKNLVHHHYHRQSSREAETFWAGCGAIRKAAFLEVGGFDASRFAQPSIEDIELGWRLRQGGFRILLAPELQATHLKVWELRNLLHTEIFQRALPWSRLIHRRTGWPDTLNVSRGERLRAILAVAFLVSLPLTWVPLWLSFALLVAAVAANRRLVALFNRRRGRLFALGAILFHQVYYGYCAGAFIWAWQEQWRLRFRGAGADDDRVASATGSPDLVTLPRSTLAAATEE